MKEKRKQQIKDYIQSHEAIGQETKKVDLIYDSDSTAIVKTHYALDGLDLEMSDYWLLYFDNEEPIAHETVNVECFYYLTKMLPDQEKKLLA